MQVPVLNSKKPIKQYNMQYKTRNAAPFLTLDNPHPPKTKPTLILLEINTNIIHCTSWFLIRRLHIRTTTPLRGFPQVSHSMNHASSSSGWQQRCCNPPPSKSEKPESKPSQYHRQDFRRHLNSPKPQKYWKGRPPFILHPKNNLRLSPLFSPTRSYQATTCRTLNKVDPQFVIMLTADEINVQYFPWALWNNLNRQSSGKCRSRSQSKFLVNCSTEVRSSRLYSHSLTAVKSDVLGSRSWGMFCDGNFRNDEVECLVWTMEF